MKKNLMKILFLAPTYRGNVFLGSRGGGEISNVLILTGLASRGHQVDVVTKNSAGFDYLNDSGVEIYGPRDLSNFKPFIFLYKNIKFKSKVGQISSCKDYDLILACTECVHDGLKIRNRTGVPLGVFIRAYENFSDHAALSDKFKSLFLGNYFESKLAEADFFIVNSIFMKEFVEARIGNVCSFVVYPCIDPEEVKVNSKKEEQGIKNITMIGTSEKKGLSLTIELARRFPNIDFHIVGVKDERIKSGLKNVHLKAWANISEEFCFNSDLVIVPSIWNEPFGRVAIEALSFNIPVLVSSRGGLPEAVMFEEKLIVKDNTIESWESKIKEVMANPNEVEHVVKRLNGLLQKYSLCNQVDVLERNLQIVLDKV